MKLKRFLKICIIILSFLIIDFGYYTYQKSKIDEVRQWYLGENASDVENAWKVKKSLLIALRLTKKEQLNQSGDKLH